MYSAIARNKRNTVFIVLIFLLIVGALGFAASALWNSPSIGFVVLVVAGCRVGLRQDGALRLGGERGHSKR